MPRYYQEVTVSTVTSTTICDFPTPGAYTWTVPTGTCQATFEIWGGGGGGAAHCCCDCYHGGRGGSGGGYSTKTIQVTPGQSYAICVGPGGMVTTTGSCTIHWCCYGQPGSTTYVTGTNLSNFCATGGGGGENTCYHYCGCTDDNAACGYGGDYGACGAPGYVGHSTNMCSNIFTVGAPSSFGGAPSYTTADHCCPGFTCGCAGTFPGGGGNTALPHFCCCCAGGGVGGNGLVRIHY